MQNQSAEPLSVFVFILHSAFCTLHFFYPPASTVVAAVSAFVNLLSAATGVYRSYPSLGIGSVAPKIETKMLNSNNAAAVAHTAG